MLTLGSKLRYEEIKADIQANTPDNFVRYVYFYLEMAQLQLVLPKLYWWIRSHSWIFKKHPTSVL